MATAETRTLLSLDTWAAVLGLNPLHFNGVISRAMPQNTCSSPTKQFAWMEADAIGREEIGQAISQAESMMAEFLGYKLLPTWEVDERLNTVQPAALSYIGVGGRDVQGLRSSVQTKWGHFISGGIESKVLIDDNAGITFTDEDGDGYFETATVQALTTVTDPCEIAVYYPVAASDGVNPIFLPGGAANDAWEIRPLRKVTIVGGTVTIKMWRHQLVIPKILLAYDPEPADGEVDADFLPSVDIYRHWNDPQQQAQLLWSPMDSFNCGCGDGDCSACTQSAQWGCLGARNYRLGEVSYVPAAWNATNSSFDSEMYAVGRNPDRLRLWYYAGYEDKSRTCPTLQMDPTFERAVAYLALSLLDRNICNCSNLQSLTRHWREDLALTSSDPAGSASYQMGKGQVTDNPFGTTRGALFAWQRVSDGRKIGRAVKI